MPATRRRDPKREQYWRDTVAAWRKSGQSVSAFCRERDVPQASFYSWRQTLSERERQRRAAPIQAASQPTLVPVRVVPEAVLEVVLPTGLVLRVPLGADAHAVAALVATLNATLRAPSC
jgi:transposase-like protein